MRRLLPVLLVLAVLAPEPTAAAPAGEPRPPRAEESAAKLSGRLPPPAAGFPTRYIVTVAAGRDIPALARELRSDMRILRRYGAAVTGFLAAMDPGAAAALARDPRVVSVTRDRVVEAAATQSGPPWGLDRIDQVAGRLDGTYNYRDAGRGVQVYVVDSGVFAQHVDFGGRVRSGFDALGRGTTADCDGHGTHVAGTVAGATYGVAKRAQVIPVRVLDCNGSGTASSLLAGLDFIVRHHTTGQPAVANLSLVTSVSAPLDAAVNRVIDDGVTVVAAAGNDGADACFRSPARVSRVITVGATNARDYSPRWSNHGPCLDLFAPGANVVSAGTASSTAAETFSGTSMASPHVAGAAARFLSRRPSAGPRAVARHLTARAIPDSVRNAGSNTVRRLLHAAGRAPVALSLEAPSSTVPSGGVVTLRGTLSNARSGVGLAQHVVALRRRPAGTSTWTPVATRSTDADGRVAVLVEVKEDSDYQLTHAATTTTRAATSPAATITLE